VNKSSIIDWVLQWPLASIIALLLEQESSRKKFSGGNAGAALSRCQSCNGSLRSQLAASDVACSAKMTEEYGRLPIAAAIAFFKDTQPAIACMQHLSTSILVKVEHIPFDY